ncbi:MAG: thermonuclease family protein [Blastocatellia bacterium]
MVKTLFEGIIIFCVASVICVAQSVNPITKTNVKPAVTNTKTVSLIEGKVVYVFDGDTVSVETKDRMIYPVRIQGIDAPEESQELSKKSRKHLEELVFEKEVKVVVKRKDQADKYVGTVFLNGQDVGLKQIEGGLAWHFKQTGYEQSADARTLYEQAELRARAQRAGIWKDRTPIAPWDFRMAKVPSATKTAETVPAPVNVKPNATTAPAKQTEDPTGKKYILGPRGGCYWVDENGKKIYVKDKSLCGQPATGTDQ